MVADIHAGSTGSRPHDIHAIGSHAVFLADDGRGTDLFALDAAELEWRRSPVDGRYYRLTAAGTWFETRAEATRRGGELATIRSQAAQDWLWRTFGPQNLWIGLQDLDRNGTFDWASGEPTTFTAWCPGEPSTSSLGEDTVHLADYAPFCSGRWNNQSPGDRYPGIVERSARPVAVESVGTGCDSQQSWPCHSYGPTTLELVSGWPRPGARLRFELDARHSAVNLPVGLVALGFDTTRWGSTPLPLDLGPFGFAAGCRLRVGPQDVAPVSLDTFGRGHWGAAVPTSTAVTGSMLFLQGLAVDVAHGSCSEASNALRLTFE